MNIICVVVTNFPFILSRILDVHIQNHEDHPPLALLADATSEGCDPSPAV